MEIDFIICERDGIMVISTDVVPSTTGKLIIGRAIPTTSWINNALSLSYPSHNDYVFMVPYNYRSSSFPIPSFFKLQIQ